MIKLGKLIITTEREQAERDVSYYGKGLRLGQEVGILTAMRLNVQLRTLSGDAEQADYLLRDIGLEG